MSTEYGEFQRADRVTKKSLSFADDETYRTVSIGPQRHLGKVFAIAFGCGSVSNSEHIVSEHIVQVCDGSLRVRARPLGTSGRRWQRVWYRKLFQQWKPLAGFWQPGHHGALGGPLLGLGLRSLLMIEV